MANVKHWTERSREDFLYSIASDFIEQLQDRMEAIPMKQSQLAKFAKVSKGYVSKMFKNPGNLSLETIIKFARIVGMKVSLVSYVDERDPENERGPINAEIFKLCWEQAQRPSNMWEMRDSRAQTVGIASEMYFYQEPRGWHGNAGTNLSMSAIEALKADFSFEPEVDVISHQMGGEILWGNQPKYSLAFPKLPRPW